MRKPPGLELLKRKEFVLRRMKKKKGFVNITQL
jgi:hypothetical protein